MNYSHEKIYHFTCDKCELWWSIAGTNINVDKKAAWYCPWCGVDSYYDEGNIPVGGEVSPEKNH